MCLFRRTKWITFPFLFNLYLWVTDNGTLSCSLPKPNTFVQKLTRGFMLAFQVFQFEEQRHSEVHKTVLNVTWSPAFIYFLLYISIIFLLFLILLKCYPEVERLFLAAILYLYSSQVGNKTTETHHVSYCDISMSEPAVCSFNCNI